MTWDDICTIEPAWDKIAIFADYLEDQGLMREVEGLRHLHQHRRWPIWFNGKEYYVRWFSSVSSPGQPWGDSQYCDTTMVRVDHKCEIFDSIYDALLFYINKYASGGREGNEYIPRISN